MTKTNFTKVEGLLEAELAKMEAQELGKLADIAQKVVQPGMRKIVEKASIAAAKTEIDRSALLHSLHRAIKQFKDPAFYVDIAISKEELAALLNLPREQLIDEQWAKLQALRPKIKEFKKKFQKMHPESADETLVEGERHKHINKRFNVKDKWLPL